jgi:hypothetical protein
MTHFIRKLNAGLTFLLIVSMGSAYGDYDNRWSGYAQDECCLPDCCDSCGWGNWFVGGGLIYWRAYESGLDTCVENFSSNSIVDDVVISESRRKSRDPHFEWNPGFRVGLGYESRERSWDIATIWTHFNQKSKGSKNGENRARWKLDFDVVDVLGAYNYQLGSCFILRPYGGVRGARIDQKLHNGVFSDETVFTSTDEGVTIFRNKQDFWGVGPVIGLEGDVEVGCGLSLYANGSVSWLYGRSHVKVFDETQTIDTIDIASNHKHHNAVITALDAELGIRWSTYMCELPFVVQFGLEHHQYYNYNRISRCGDLSFDGFNFSIGLGF